MESKKVSITQDSTVLSNDILLPWEQSVVEISATKTPKTINKKSKKFSLKSSIIDKLLIRRSKRVNADTTCETLLNSEINNTKLFSKTMNNKSNKTASGYSMSNKTKRTEEDLSSMVSALCKLVNKSIRLVRKQKERKNTLTESINSTSVNNSKQVEFSIDEYKKPATILLDTTILEESSVQIQEAKITQCTRLIKKGLVNPPKTTSTPQVMLPLSPIKPPVSQQNTPIISEKDGNKIDGTFNFPNKEFEEKLIQLLRSKKLMYTTINKDQSVNNDNLKEVFRQKFKEMDSLNVSINKTASPRKCKHHHCKKSSSNNHHHHHHHHHHYHRHEHHYACSRYACCQKTLLNYAFCE